MREVRFTPDGWDAYVWWQSQDRKTLKRINTLIDAACRTPFTGIGKPEPLVGNLAGLWSRRIDDMHRLVYEADEVSVTVVACRFHYDD
jgi:toxin YoeB